MKKNILWDEIIPNYEDFFQTLLQNMVKRHNFNESMKDMIDHIIEEGKALAVGCKEREKLTKMIYESSKNKGLKINLNKHYFYIGLTNGLNSTINEDRLEKLKEIFEEEESYGGKSFSDLNRRKNKLLTEKIAKHKEKDEGYNSFKKQNTGVNNYDMLLQGLLKLVKQNKVNFFKCRIF
jgi:hypothetical protein